MSHFAYLGVLIVSLVGITAYDMTHKKILTSVKKGLLPIIASFLILLAADITGIALNIFHTNSAFVSGIFIGTPDLPLEEMFLLFLLPYLTLLLV